MEDIYYHATAEQDFDRARRKAALSSLFSFAAGTRDELLSLDEARDILKPHAESFRGVQTIEVAKIVGSEGRYADFNQRFLPRRDSVRHRWRRVHMAHQQDIALPAIQVYELGGYYFIRDGNHRVSVAIQIGQTFIEAHVTSLETDVKLGEIGGVDDLRRAVLEYEREQFISSLEQVELDREIRFTATGGFDDLALHIAGHRWVVGKASGEKLTYTAATLSWYRSVYLPITQFIRDSRVLDYVPDRTEADCYVWLVRHWDSISDRTESGYRPNRRLRRPLARQMT